MPKTIETISYIRVGNVEHPIDAVTINGRQIPSASELLPNISSSDNGKILRVLNGQWSLFSPGSLYDEINGIDCGNEPTFAEQYLTFEILTNGTIGWKSYDDTCQKTISYSINDGTWTEITATSAGVTIPVSTGDKVRFKGENSNYALSNTSYSGFGNVGTSTYNVYGNIMSLIYGDNFEDQLTLTNDYAFYCLFDGGNVVSAENLILPSMTLTPHCYRALFANCSYFTTAPALPATTLAESCYRFMFSADNLLTSVPEILPATTLYKECYYGMFNGCSSITTAPELPAPTLTTSCYKQMFMGCSHLNYIKCLATDISSGSPTTSWVSSVAASGTFVKAVDMSSWTINSANGIPTGWTVEDDEKDYLTFDIKTDGNITWKMTSSSATAKTISYSKNGGEWTEITSSTEGVSIPVVTGDEVRFKGSNNAYGDASFGGTSQFDATGNIMSLIGGDGFDDTTTLSTGSFNTLFKNCTGLKSAEDLLLPATTLASNCYFGMFQGCTSLTTAPELPATTLAESCYRSMFYGCTSLTSAPELPATTLAESCYRNMFYGCTSLITVPSDLLPATTLASNCYRLMFQNCTNLTTAPELPATTLAENCYYLMFNNCSLTTAPELPATTLAVGCYRSMFQGCTSLTTVPELPATTLTESCYYQMFNRCTSLTTVPSDLLPATTLTVNCYREMFQDCTSLTTVPSDLLPATTLASNCYYQMFRNCTSLTTAPELPATTLTSYCYSNMFSGCSSLNYIKCLATNISASYCTNSWVSGVAASGTFVKDPNMSSWTTGNNGIPTGWTIDYSNDYLTFDVKSDGNITWTVQNSSNAKTISYSKNDGTWTDITSTTSGATIPVVTGDKVRFKGDNSTYGSGASFSSCNRFGGTATYEVYGNIMSLVDSTSFGTLTTLNSNYTFGNLFYDCTSLLSVTNLSLPATTLAYKCYEYMFLGCTSLTTVPTLPATTLATGCYQGMFQGCTSLTTAPELPATTLAENCYTSMFSGCTSLTTAPSLPVMNLANGCYWGMFQDCTSLTTAPVLPATTLQTYCYYQMFSGCTSLTTAPDLPALLLKAYCYASMFSGCSNLNYVKCLATNISASYCVNNWLRNVKTMGTFVKNSNMSSWEKDQYGNGVPQYWTIINA